MFASKTVIIASMIVVVIAMCFITSTNGIPADITDGIDKTPTCITNCAQCKKMFGKFFDGQACAQSCIRFKGKAIIDCEDADSIAPFLKKESKTCVLSQ